jgi:hypothetical protein
LDEVKDFDISDTPMPSLEIEYYSMFLWGRRPMPANVANHLAQLVCDQHVQSVLAIGVTSTFGLNKSTEEVINSQLVDLAKKAAIAQTKRIYGSFFGNT